MTNSNLPTFPLTIGMDLGARKSSFCVLGPTKQRLQEGSIRTRRNDLVAVLDQYPDARLIIEASGPARWIAELAEFIGHEVIVANPREFRVIAASHKKSDRNDARILASFGQVCPELLHPVKLRGVECQIARGLLIARQHLVQERTHKVNFIRSQVRNLGEVLPSGSASSFHRKAKPLIPKVLRTITETLFDVLEALDKSIKVLDRKIEELCKTKFSQASILMQIPGVGPNTALAYVATIEDPDRFAKSRDVGAYLGLAPKARSSGSKDPDLRISKRGDQVLRKLLVNASTYILTRGEDSDLRRHGEKIRARGGKAVKAKARIAVARKLAVILHRMWQTGEVYDPNRNLILETQAA